MHSEPASEPFLTFTEDSQLPPFEVRLKSYGIDELDLNQAISPPQTAQPSPTRKPLLHVKRNSTPFSLGIPKRRNTGPPSGSSSNIEIKEQERNGSSTFAKGCI
jgi:hypothetical protein